MNNLLSIFIGGENRIVLPFLAYPPLLTIPSLLLSCLVVIPNDKLSSISKQILSIPILLALLLVPFGFTNGNKIVDLVGGVASYNLFLRFLELYWVGPFVQHRPVYATPENLWIDFWGCMRIFPKPAKEDTKELKKGQVKVFTKDKKFHHIIVSLLLNVVIIDVICSWMTTFTSNEFISTWFDRPKLFFVIYFFANIILNSAFNCTGYLLHLFYCIAIEGGTYSSDQWRTLMIHPILSTTLDDLWSTRWHQLFKSTWLAFPFRPVRILTIRLLTKRVKNPKAIGFIIASIAVFVASAGMHEYVIAANMGLPIYNRVFKGEQFIFFFSHGLGVFIEHVIELIVAPKLSKEFKDSMVCYLIKRAWTITFGYYTFYYIFNGFISWGFQFDSPFTFTQPWILDQVRAYPILRDFIGTNVPI